MYATYARSTIKMTILLVEFTLKTRNVWGCLMVAKTITWPGPRVDCLLLFIDSSSNWYTIATLQEAQIKLVNNFLHIN